MSGNDRGGGPGGQIRFQHQRGEWLTPVFRELGVQRTERGRYHSLGE